MISTLTLEDSSGTQWSFMTDASRLQQAQGLAGVTGPQGSGSTSRVVIANRPNRDGSYNRTRYAGDRAIVLAGVLTAPDEAGIWAAFDDLQYVLGQAKAVERPLRWTRASDGIVLRAMVKLDTSYDAPIKASDAGVVLPYQVTLRASDPNAYIDTEVVTSSPTLASALAGGSTYPNTYPDTYVGGAAGTPGWVDYDNPGTADTWPVFVIHGDAVNPVISRNDDPTGERITLAVSLAAGDTLTLDAAARTITTGAGISDLAVLDVVHTRWFSLPARTAGACRLTASSGSGWLDLHYRPAYS